MHVVIADPAQVSAQAVAERVMAARETSQAEIVRDLATAYTIAEHKVPDIFFVSEALAKVAEFEVLLVLFRALAIRCVVVIDDTGTSGQIRSLSQRLGVDAVPATEVDRVLQHGAKPGVAARYAPGAATSGGDDLQFDDGVILLGASTGGVDALIQVLARFPRNCPRTFVVQHTSAHFTPGFVSLLDSHVAPRVVQADMTASPKAGEIHIAPGGDRHLQIKGTSPLRIRLERSSEQHPHCPSVDELFWSAVPFAKRVTAGLLTGMGRDGARGLLALRQAGARTFAQDEATCVVYGMPKAARDLGSVERTLPLAEIGPALLATRRRVL